MKERKEYDLRAIFWNKGELNLPVFNQESFNLLILNNNMTKCLIIGMIVVIQYFVCVCRVYKLCIAAICIP